MSSAKQPRVDDLTPPEPGAHSHHLLAFHHHPLLLRHPRHHSSEAAGTDDLRMAAANRLVKAGVARSYSGHAFKFGHESAGQHVLEPGSNWRQGTGAVDQVKDPRMVRVSSLLDLAKEEGLQTVFFSGATDDNVSNHFKVNDEVQGASATGIVANCKFLDMQYKPTSCPHHQPLVHTVYMVFHVGTVQCACFKKITAPMKSSSCSLH